MTKALRLSEHLDIAGGNSVHLAAAQVPSRQTKVRRIDGAVVEVGHGLQKLHRAREVAKLMGGMSLAGFAEIDVSGWADLTQQMYTKLQIGIDQGLEKVPSKSLSPDIIHRIRNDSLSGSAQITAFFAVMPELLFNRDFVDPNSAIATIAKRSKGAIMQWASLREDIEGDLVYGAAYPKPDLTNDNYMKRYGNLRYHPKWFMVTDEDKVMLDSSKIHNMRGEKGKHIDRQLPPDAVWYGCPARTIIPTMYDGMLAAVENNDLFGKDYHMLRANHGYAEEWQNLVQNVVSEVVATTL